MKKILVVLALCVMVLLLAGCGDVADNTPEKPAETSASGDTGSTAGLEESLPGAAAEDQTENSAKPSFNSSAKEDSSVAIAGLDFTVTSETNPLAVIIMENGGVIVVELYPDVAPNTVNNFIHLANSGYYDGVIFHRVAPGFVIQGGDPDGTGRGGPGYGIFGEYESNGFKNELAHDRGVISMARRGDPEYNSAGSQFFICVADAKRSLDGKYAGFGRTLYGMDVVDEIVAQPAVDQRPVQEQKIKSIYVDTRGVDYPPPETIPN